MISDQFNFLARSFGSISLFLVRFVLFVSANVTQEEPVGKRGEDGEGVEQVVGVEEQGVGKMSELVTEVAACVSADILSPAGRMGTPPRLTSRKKAT